MHSKRILDKRKNVIYMYVVEKLSVKRISTLCDINRGTVYSLLKAANVKMRKASDYNKKQHKESRRRLNFEEYRNLLIYLYQVLKLKRSDMALLFTTSISKVDKLLKKYEITRKSK